MPLFFALYLKDGSIVVLLLSNLVYEAIKIFDTNIKKLSKSLIGQINITNIRLFMLAVGWMARFSG
ncbi:hypothetical protein KKC1_01600 [Calderihabitans maritimus]|uniref:Uncharacterized protein n=1 Tax=Calderihabitans maritimus TaxID=1246530 RepID=A0A1Z5HNG3_9FIRM|nr:hypothetical protein KKC1_01600 [Calderihabitans maritimus]